MKTQTSAFVLRVGLVMEGRIVQERVLRAGEPVTVGSAAKNTFSFPGAGLPRQHLLFQPRGMGYLLHAAPDMRGKLSHEGRIQALEQLLDPDDKQGLALTPSSRGKVQVGQLTVLFQFVPPPPEMLVPNRPGDFRPRLIDPDDPVFHGFLGLWTALAAVLMIFVWTHPPIEYTAMDVEVEDWIAEVYIEPPEPVDTPEPEIVSDDGETVIEPTEVVEPEPADQPAEPVEEPGGGGADDQEPAADDPGPQGDPEADALQAAEDHQRAVDDVIDSSPLLAALIAQTGENHRGMFVDEDPMGEQLREDLDGVRGVAIADAEGLAGIREGDRGDGSTVGLGEMHMAGEGSSGPGPGEFTDAVAELDLDPQVNDDEEPIPLGGTGDMDLIRQTIRGYMGQVRHCYVQALNKNPSTQGRVAVQFQINRGRVIAPTLFSNDTGSPELGGCIVRQISKWRFPNEIQTEVVYPFALSL